MRMFIQRSLLTCILGCWAFCLQAQQQVSLAGSWRFAIDQQDWGVVEKWYTTVLTDSIRLPGSMAGNGKGDDITLATKWTGSIYDSSWFFAPRLAKYRQAGNIKVPFWLTPVKHYVGVAGYQREVMIPQHWQRERICLFLERVHTISQVWIDDKPLAGTQNSLSTPHEYDATVLLSPGRHRITIRIDNRIKDMNVGPDSHSVTDHTQGNWNGITGSMLLKAGAQIEINDLQVYPEIAAKKAALQLLLAVPAGKTVKGTITVTGKSVNTTQQQVLPVITRTIRVNGDTSKLSIELPLGEQMLLWDEFDPALYQVNVAVTDDAGTQTTKTVQFGMRQFGVSGTNFAVNGRPVMLRGTVNNCEFPLTGYPPMDVPAWERIFKIAKAHGQNHMRFHSWCPPEAAFEAADKQGFYLQPEAPTWPNHGTSLGDGRFIDQYIYEETNRMVKAYGNHPSFCMLAAGNEPAGRNQATYLARFIEYWRARDKRRVYTGASVAMSWPLVPNNDYMIKSGARGLSWKQQPNNNDDYANAIAPFGMPYVTHEMGQWCAFPDFTEIKQYTGVYRAKNFEMFQEDLNDQGMGNMAASFLQASGKLQALCYKYEIEKTLRTKGLGGFQLLGLQDFPGQGTALVGVLNAFWEEKGYISANAFRRFCNSTVPLIRMSRFVNTNAEQLNAAVEIYHYGNLPLRDAVIQWTIKDDNGTVVAKGEFAKETIPIGNGQVLGNIDYSLAGIKKATKLNIEVTIANTSFANDWDVWLYPAALPALTSNELYECDTLDTKAEAVLHKGGTVLLHAAGKVVKGKEVVQQFTPVFWNTSWFKMRPPHTLGFVCDPTHPVFNDFPTSGYPELQWWEIVNRAQVMHLEDFPKGLCPLIQHIDTWFMNRRLATLFEVKVGAGTLVVCSADLKHDLDKRPVARQLYYSLRTYMLSPDCHPSGAVPIALVRDIFQTGSKLVFDAHTKDSPDELKPKQTF